MIGTATSSGSDRQHAPCGSSTLQAALLLLVLVTPSPAQVPESSKDAGPPDIVLLFVDDLGVRDPSFMGGKHGPTPHIDRIASEGMVFTSAYANAPNCAPSRAAIMSGQWAARTGVYTVGSSARGKKTERRWIPVRNRTTLDPGVRTLAEGLKAAGYTTMHVGKWHLGPAGSPSGPKAQGFDRQIAGGKAGHPKSYFSPYRNAQLEDGPEGEYLTDRLTTEALKFLEPGEGPPRFLHMSYFTVHTPIQPRPDLLEVLRSGGHERRAARYAAMIRALDESVGRILKAIEESGRDTLVVFTSDNGGHGAYTSHEPSRGSKGMLYEGGIRVPLALRWPGKIAAGTRAAVPVQLFDLHPTFLTLGGAKPEQLAPLDGVDLAPLLLRGEAPPKRALFWHFPAYLERYRALPPEVRWRAVPSSVIRLGRHKLIDDLEQGRQLLFDLEVDPSERKDLADARPEIVAELLAELDSWRRRTRAAMPTERNPAWNGN